MTDIRKLSTVLSCTAFLIFFMINTSASEPITYTDSWGNAGYNLVSGDAAGVEVVFSITYMSFEEMQIGGQNMQIVALPGVILPNNPGAPNLPGMGRYIALPEGAHANVKIVDFRTEVYHDFDLAPAAPIQFDTDDSPPVYQKDDAIYQTNAYYPDAPVKISQPTDIRGVDAVILGITPFQYNPVTKELLVYRDIRIKVDFIGGNGHFGEDRLRSRYWEPILKGNLLNYSSLPEVNMNRVRLTDEDNVEYVIIVPDDPAFLAWADTLKQWRTEQGIITGITPLSEIGGNNATAIENYINNAYNTWDIPPVAVLLLSDYQSSGDVYGITSPVWNSYCVSDNIYGDINGNNLPQVSMARIVAQNNGHLASMIGKMLEYERTPPTDPGFYQHPLMACGWQTERWFTICTEVIYGYMAVVHNKQPVRQYAIYSGTPGSSWSSNPNTYMIVNYFGPTGLGYIPANLPTLPWTGNAAGVNAAINSGCFILQHRDHGGETGWGEPSYSNGNLSGLSNDMYPFVFSINCLTGKYNWSSECFSEAFHRMEHGALGVTCASEVSYSFVNDAYVWGMYDSMYPDFDPGYGTNDPGPNNLRPCFANSYGKYYLEASSWPYNPQNKVHTDHLFHHFGDAFITFYSEVPQNLTVTHNDALLGGADSFTVTANVGSIISLTVNGEIIAVADGTGAQVVLPIEPQLPGNTMLVTVTNFNYYRYSQPVSIIPPEGPYVTAGQCVISDAGGWNPNGQLDYDETSHLSLTMSNIGIENAVNVVVTLSTTDPLLTIIDNSANYGTIIANNSITITDGFEVSASPATPDEHNFIITATSTAGTATWESDFVITGHAPVIAFDRIEFDDPTGNNNGWLDPGEEADMMVYMTNDGSSTALNVESILSSIDPYLTIIDNLGSGINLIPGASDFHAFVLSAAPNTPQEHIADAELALSGSHSFTNTMEFEIQIGNHLYDPTGPDNYGYLAYDPMDAPENPVYDWFEISSDSGGPGSQIPFVSDDQCIQYVLPFTFQYYGVEYDTFTVGCNGWVGMGVETVDDYSNSGIPDADGPRAMIAPYWEDLSPQRTNSGKVWRYYDAAGGRYIVEYNHIEQYLPTGNFETFQVILYDPAIHQTATGDGRIMFQYKDMSIASQTEGTMGIENHLSNDGLQYLFDGDLDYNAHPIENQMAVLYTTATATPSLAVTLTPVNPPIIIPVEGGTFNYSLLIENIGTSVTVFDAWIEAVLPNGSVYGPILLRPGLALPPGASISRTMTQNVPGSAPAGDYTYRLNTGVHPNTIYASDEFGFSKAGMDASGNTGGWKLDGWEDNDLNALAIPDNYYLSQNSPNPFNPVTEIAFGLKEAGNVELKVFNLLGREIQTLKSEYMPAGNYKISFNASDLSSGIYFYMLKTKDFTGVKKMLLVK